MEQILNIPGPSKSRAVEQDLTVKHGIFPGNVVSLLPIFFLTIRSFKSFCIPAEEEKKKSKEIFKEISTETDGEIISEETFMEFISQM